MGGNTQYTKALDSVARIALAYSGIGSGHVFQGHYRVGDATNLDQSIGSGTPVTASGGTGWFYCHLDSVEVKRNFNVPDMADFAIKAGLLVYVPRETSNNLDAAWDYAIGLASGLSAPANYSGSLAPQSVRIRYAGYEVLGSVGIAKFCFGSFDEGGGIDFVDP